jgi:hypothetical protein
VFEIESTEYGIEIDLSGSIDRAEVEEFYEELETETARQPDGFSIRADHRDLNTLPEGADEMFADLMAMCKDNGLGKSVVVFDSTVNKMQHERLKEEAGLDDQMIVDASSNDDWRAEVRDWVTN